MLHSVYFVNSIAVIAMEINKNHYVKLELIVKLQGYLLEF